MTEYYDDISPKYLALLNRTTKHYRFKIELLDHWERTMGEIVNDISSDSAGQITINKEQGIRRSCSFSLIDVEDKYIPKADNPFWYNRKFKLYIGMYDKSEDSIYWFSEGVYITQNASAVHNVVTVNGVDKFALFDGTLNTQICQETHKVPMGTCIAQLIRDTLILDMGNGIPADPITPIIDVEMESQTTLDEIVLNEGQFIGELFTEIANSLGCDVYYDRFGRLRFSRVFNDDLPYWYRHKGALWKFADTKINYIDPSVDYTFDGVNTVTVTTDNSEGKIYSYTAKNNNPSSPVSVSNIGIRCDNSNPIIYIPIATGLSPKAMCREHARYVLLQHTTMSVNVNFQTTIMPHLDVDEAVLITDDYYEWENQKFLIQSLTIPFGVGTIQISATNIQWLPYIYDDEKE